MSVLIDKIRVAISPEKKTPSLLAKNDLLEFLCVAAPKIIGGICSLALNLLLLRYFGPEEFGLYALCTAAILLSDAIFGSAVDLGVVRLASVNQGTAPASALIIQKAAFYIKVTVVLVATGFVMLSAGVIERDVLHRTNTGQLIFLSCLAALGLMLLRSAQTNVQIERNFPLYGGLEILQLSMKYGGISLLLAFGSVKPGWVLFFFAAGPLAAFLTWLALVSKKFRGVGRVRLEHFQSLFRTVKWFALTFGLGALLSRLDIFLVSTWSSISEAGIFGAAQVFALIPQMLGTYMAVVYSPRLMPYLRDGKFADFFRQFQTIMIAFCVVIFALAFPALKFFGTWVLPGRFVTAHSAILVLLPGALAGLATFPVTITFLMFVRPRFLFTLDCIVLPFVILSYAYAIPRYGAIGAAWVTSGSCVTRAAIAQLTAWRWLRRRPDMQRAALAELIAVGEKVPGRGEFYDPQLQN
ncbi:MAG: hypothetical protein WCE61_02485 [Candidatus Acidiferrum sp.]